MDKNTPVSQVMTIDLISVGPNDLMTKVRDIFQENDFHHIPVVENRKVVGIISKGDFHQLESAFTFFRKEKTEAYNEAVFRSLLVSEVMKDRIATIKQNEPVKLAASYFRENLFHCLPVVTDEGSICGMVTTLDLLNYAYQ
ncbi:MAG: CBS domain-containing protein [Saprospiraceae bacterium]|nr:CBS domain-containing protein [Saprospiraceae bacterium]